MKPPEPGRPLATPGFLLVSAITFVTFFAAFQLFPTAPLHLRRMGASLAESGRFMTAFTAGSSLGALFTGPLGDRVGQRRMMVACACGFGLMLAAYGLLTARWAFHLLAFPHGVVWSGLLTATMATLGRVLPEDRRAEGLTLYGLASPAGVVFGPLVGLAVYQHWGFAAMAGSLGAAFLVLGALALRLEPDAGRTAEKPPMQLPGRAMLGPASVLMATALGYGALGSYTAQEGLALRFPPVLGLSTAPAFLTCMAVGMVLCRLLMAQVGFGGHPTRLLPGMLATTAAALGLLAFMPGGLSRHVLAALIYGGGYSMVHTLVNAHLLETTPAERRGAAFGAALFAFDSGIGIGSLAIGGLIGWSCRGLGAAGYRVGWALAAALALAAVPLSRRLQRPAEPVI